MAAFTTIALATVAAASAYSAYSAHEGRKDQEAATNRAEAQAKAAQDEQAALAAKEEKASASSLKDQQARLLKGSRGRSGLLFGSELGTEDTTNTKQTLGA